MSEKRFCLVCGNDEFKKTIYGGYNYLNKTYDIVSCKKCGFMFVDPTPEIKLLEDIYKDKAYFDNYCISDLGLTNYIKGVEKKSKRVNRIINLIKRYKTSGRLLDVGCAGGRFLKHLTSAGFECTGIEPNLEMSDYIKNKLKLPVECNNLSAVEFNKNSFDVIFMADAVEHLPDLNNCFGLLSKWLKDDGVIFIDQPLTYNRSLFNLVLRILMFFKNNRYSLNPPLHLWEFTPDTLGKFLKKKGFRVDYLELYDNCPSLPLQNKSYSAKSYALYFLKKISSFLSNVRFLRFLRLGNRGIFICKKTKPRILFVHNNLDVGGAEVNRLCSLKAINKNKYDLSVCCLFGKGKVAEEILNIGIPVFCLGSSDKSYNILTTLKLFSFIKKGGYDIVHTCLSNTNLHGRIAAKLASVPIIIAEEQSDYERYNKRLAFLFKSINRVLASITNRIITCSDSVTNAISASEKIPIDKFLTLHNCIDESLLVVKKAREGFIKELNLEGKYPVLTYVASFSKRKGHDLIITLLGLLKVDFPNIVLLLVGTGPLMDSISDLAKQKGLVDSVRFLGVRRDVADILNITDVFVSTAKQEAFGINLIEAMYMQKPCVAFRVGGIPEVIDNGINGSLVDKYDIDKMKDEVTKLIKNPGKAKGIGKKARSKVLENFTASSYAKNLENLYDSLLEKNEKM